MMKVSIIHRITMSVLRRQLNGQTARGLITEPVKETVMVPVTGSSLRWVYVDGVETNMTSKDFRWLCLIWQSMQTRRHSVISFCGLPHSLDVVCDKVRRMGSTKRYQSCTTTFAPGSASPVVDLSGDGAALCKEHSGDHRS